MGEEEGRRRIAREGGSGSGVHPLLLTGIVRRVSIREAITQIVATLQPLLPGGKYNSSNSFIVSAVLGFLEIVASFLTIKPAIERKRRRQPHPKSNQVKTGIKITCGVVIWQRGRTHLTSCLNATEAYGILVHG
tara:strand:+ start:622 stop:1023 length:402 start_codon:yes stop_codon:yes gene_type:complete